MSNDLIKLMIRLLVINMPAFYIVVYDYNSLYLLVNFGLFGYIVSVIYVNVLIKPFLKGSV